MRGALPCAGNILGTRAVQYPFDSILAETLGIFEKTFSPVTVRSAFVKSGGRMEWWTVPLPTLLTWQIFHFFKI